ncbi:MAG: hypothetical protein ACP5NS_00160 [Candidatus Pacearchaeota archaeon]
MVFGRRRILDYIYEGVENFTEQMGSMAKQKVNSLIHSVEYRVIMLQERMLKKLMYFTILAGAIIFLALGGFYLLKEFFIFSNALAFFVIGIFLLIIAIFIKISERSVM